MKGYIFVQARSFIEDSDDDNLYLTKNGMSWYSHDSIQKAWVHPESKLADLRKRLKESHEFEIKPDLVYPAEYTEEKGVVITGVFFYFDSAISPHEDDYEPEEVMIYCNEVHDIPSGIKGGDECYFCPGPNVFQVVFETTQRRVCHRAECFLKAIDEVTTGKRHPRS